MTSPGRRFQSHLRGLNRPSRPTEGLRAAEQAALVRESTFP